MNEEEKINDGNLNGFRMQNLTSKLQFKILIYTYINIMIICHLQQQQ